MDKAFYWIGIACVGLSALYFVSAFTTAFIGWLFKKLGIAKHSVYFWDVIVTHEALDKKDRTPND